MPARRTITLLPTAVLLALAAATAPADPPPESRPAGDVPPVFRCIFEDRSRMVIVHPTGSDLWIAFNPGTCGVQKIWRGAMDFRGKVWDFSQDNCRAAEGAEVWLAADPPLVELPDAPGAADGSGWATPGAAFDPDGGGWRFEGAGSRLVSPAFDTTLHTRIFVAFDERSRATPVRVDVSGDDGLTWLAQSFLSATHGSSDTDWQFNFRQIDVQASRTRVRVASTGDDPLKRVRRVRVFGDGPAWQASVDDHPARVRTVWRGYERPPAGPDAPAVTLLYDLIVADREPVRVRHSVSLIAGHTIVEDLDLRGRPGAPTLRLLRPRDAKTSTLAEGDATSQPGESFEMFSIPPVDRATRRITLWTRRTRSSTAP